MSKSKIAEKSSYITKYFCASVFSKVVVTSNSREKQLFSALAVLKLYNELHHYMDSEFKYTSKNFVAALPRHIFGETNVFRKKGF